ncbi:hypothetical protein PHYC_03768 [Phycisphaerales bacterium]|nr:hypothetical protein PHYC_03768 [Phycisphaerales bacterium]
MPTWISPVTLHDPLCTTIRLEPLDVRHAHDLLAAADPRLFLHSPQDPPEWSVAGFERDIARVTNLPGVVAFAIILAGGPSAGRAVGRTTYMDIRPDHRGLEIGRTWISRPFHGTRINPEIKFLMLRHAFELLAPAAIRVAFTTGETNLHSQTAIAKLGATREGLLRDTRIMPPSPARPRGFTCGTVYYSILAAEWPRVCEGLMRRLA